MTGEERTRSGIASPPAEAARVRRRRALGRAFELACMAMALLGALVLVTLLIAVFRQGIGWLDWEFLTSFPSRFPEKAGIESALWGTLWVIATTALLSVPLGIGAAVYLEELARPTRLNGFIQINIANLAGVPSIVYGILGLAIFVRAAGLGRSVIAGALTLSLLILPVIIIATREALRAVPSSVRLAAFAVGATRWQTVRDHVLPASLPGILTGLILALSRAIGETAPLIMIGALTYVAFVPDGMLSGFTALPIQIFNWASRPQEDFHGLAAAGIIVLLVVLLSMNSVAAFVRHRFGRRRW
ncbi:MAG: phosphate ABC transporter permease PstA [Thermoanaerobaculia bacterium]